MSNTNGVSDNGQCWIANDCYFEFWASVRVIPYNGLAYHS